MDVNDDEISLNKGSALKSIASSLLHRVIHSSFYRMALDEVSLIGFDCFRYLSKRNLLAYVEAQHTSAPSQHPRLAQ